jgi:RNA polymerase sigma-70 factor (ECF subfamily)
VALRQEEFTGLGDDVDLGRDRALVERCQAGDSAAYGNLYARYNERLLRVCLRRLNDRHEAEDATQEAFARALKALPNFAGERRFYPWLTVIAGNICTDMLRRRSRSTPTDDFELGLYQPIGSSGDVTCDEMVIAAVDGELVHQALDRLSVRHRNVLALREGSGLTYQQIADREGVEIGTIETLLWRARQALKREFNVLSESKGAFAGFLVGAGVFARRGFLRLAPRHVALQASAATGNLRNAVAGVAVAGVAVAAAVVAPHALGSHANTPAERPAPAAAVRMTGTISVTPDSVAPRAATAASGPASPISVTGDPSSSGPLGATVGAVSGPVARATTPPLTLGLPTVGSSVGTARGTITAPSPTQQLLKTLASGAFNATAPWPVTQPFTSALGSAVETTSHAATSTVGAPVGALLSLLPGLPESTVTPPTIPTP